MTEVCQAINSKQLVPTVRTQYMRTAFQIPFDATVRISLDTNLCMLTETGRLGMDQVRREAAAGGGGIHTHTRTVTPSIVRLTKKHTKNKKHEAHLPPPYTHTRTHVDTISMRRA